MGYMSLVCIITNRGVISWADVMWSGLRVISESPPARAVLRLEKG